MSQDELATISGVQRSQISKIESGKVDIQISTVQKLAKSLDIVLPDLFKETKKINIHPFVKWAGGKKKLLGIIRQKLPLSFGTYFEPFIGGGALLFDIQPKKAVINDANEELICVYKCLQNQDLFEKMKEKIIVYEQMHSDKHFYELREMDKDESFKDLPVYERAARMIYLNKACFGGLYRVNSSGYFNVPSGKKTKVSCFDRKTFDNLPKYFKRSNITILCGDFEAALKTAKAGDFVYLDPPYDSWDGKQSFTDYNEKDFTKEDQKRVFKCLPKIDLKRRICNVIQSQH